MAALPSRSDHSHTAHDRLRRQVLIGFSLAGIVLGLGGALLALI
jgi:hypothetical protein